MQGMRIKSHKGYFNTLPTHFNNRSPWAPKPFSALEGAATPLKTKSVVMVPRPAAPAKAKPVAKKRVARKAAKLRSRK